MKTLMVSLFAALAFVVGEAYADQHPTIEGTTLVVTETVRVMEIPGVPKGLSAHDALELVTAERPHAFIEGKGGKKSYSVGLFSIRQTIETPRKSVMYRHPGEWVVTDASPMTKDDHSTFSWLFIYMPGLCIGILVFINVFSGAGKKDDLVIFYLLIFLGAFITSIWISPYGVFPGMFMGGFAGYLVTGRQENDVAGPGVIFGGAIGTFVTMCAYALSETHNPGGLLLYGVTMVAIGGVSFAAALSAKSVKVKVRTMIAAKRA